MTWVDLFARLGVSVLPVLLFLLLLVYMDSYQLVAPRRVLAALAWGCCVAVVSLAANRVLLEALGVSPSVYSRYAAPFVEESLKAAPVAALILRRRTGFLVDAAIVGFAVGAGFAIVENTWYAGTVPNAGMFVWTIRGFGTAVMHGGLTCGFAIVSQALHGRRRGDAAALLPGLLCAMVVHSAYNHFVLPPTTATLVLYATLPPLVLLAFHRSDRALRAWLGRGVDEDTALLEALRSGDFGDTPAGRYIASLAERFPPEVVVDMICAVRLRIELGLSAKGMLMMRATGLNAEPPPDARAKLEELRHLERTIGPAGRLALRPLFDRSTRELWQIHMLEHALGS